MCFNDYIKCRNPACTVAGHRRLLPWLLHSCHVSWHPGCVKRFSKLVEASTINALRWDAARFTKFTRFTVYSDYTFSIVGSACPFFPWSLAHMYALLKSYSILFQLCASFGDLLMRGGFRFIFVSNNGLPLCIVICMTTAT